MEPKVLDWLKLAQITEIGPVRGRSLLERFGTPDRILASSFKEIAAVLGSKLARLVLQKRDSLNIDSQLELIENCGVKLIPWDDPLYPENLKHIFDPPLVLFLRGNIVLEDNFSIAIVGTRRATIYGMNMAAKISSQLAERGFTIISGAARGIDTSAHQAALRINSRTIAVIGCGVDVVYPQENAGLFERIVNNGAIISEFPMGIPPLRQNFPRRNRIISGLSMGVVVVEAPMRSGAMITVSSALQQGREVFCVPGQADSFNMQGSHQLIKEGAKLVQDVDDILQELQPLVSGYLNSGLKF